MIMIGKKRWIAGGVVFVLLFIVNVSVALYFYKQYNDNINAINQQGWLTKIKVESLEKSSELLKGSLDAFGQKFASYDQGLDGLDKRVVISEMNSKELMAKMQSIKLDIEDWQRKYNSALSQISDLKERSNILTADMERLKKDSPSNVDLGRISVDGATSGSQAVQRTTPSAEMESYRRGSI